MDRSRGSRERWQLGCGEPSMPDQENGSRDGENLKEGNWGGTCSFIFVFILTFV